jgi:hypothetical protein
MIMLSKHLIIVITSFLVIALVYTPSITFAVENCANHENTTCTPAGMSDKNWILTQNLNAVKR